VSQLAQQVQETKNRATARGEITGNLRGGLKKYGKSISFDF